jgi:hypothetical protein
MPSFYIKLFLALQELKNDRFKIPKSRYDSVDLYLSTEWTNRPEYNDNDVPYDQEIYERLRNHGEVFRSSISLISYATARFGCLIIKTYGPFIYSRPACYIL